MAEFVLTPQIKAMALRSLQELRGETVFIVNAETSKPIRVGPGGQVTANGGLGPHARFRVRRGDRPHRLGPVVRFENVATGKYLAIKNGNLTVGTGGEHCEFIVEMAQMAVFLKKHNNPGARIGFNPNGQPVPANTLGDGARGRFFIFDCDQVAPSGGHQQAAAAQRQAAIAQQQAAIAQQQAAIAQQQAAAAAAAAHSQAQFVLTPQIKALALRSMGDLRGETVYIVNAETSKPVQVRPNGAVTADGGLNAHAAFRVRRGDRPHRLGPVVRFENVATGKYLAIKNGNLTIGTGGEHCEFIVEMAQMAVFLKKHNNPGARIGFNPNGQPVPANTLGDGARGRFFIFDCQQVQPVQQAPVLPQAHAVPQAHAHAQPHHHHPHPQQPHHHHPQPHHQPAHHGAPQASAPRAGQRCLLRMSDNPNLHVHVNGGSREGNPAICKGHHQFAMSHPASQFVFKPTAFPNTFIIKVANANLFLHALGGSKEGSPVVLHGDEQYARTHPNSKFQVVNLNHGFALKVHDQDLCVHAFGGSKEGSQLKLHGNVHYARDHPNSQFHFVAV